MAKINFYKKLNIKKVDILAIIILCRLTTLDLDEILSKYIRNLFKILINLESII